MATLNAIGFPVGATVPRSAELVVRRTAGSDLDGVTAMLARQPESNLYFRFQSAIGSPPRPSIVKLLLQGNGGTWLAERGDVVAGHGMWAWVTEAAIPTAEIAIIVDEAEQGRGLGSRLFDLAVADAIAAGTRQFLLIVSAMNDKVLRMVRRRCPGAVFEYSGSLVTVTVDAADLGIGAGTRA
ncbi:GNAT family N-acetyltransferase [Kribbella sp. NPDC051587]|uniref:GNAT family N-acetyltransferase n=1 Tax=Kribbella sp. NPDC051587 TaxID=3364119 RepID=UPI00378CA722